MRGKEAGRGFPSPSQGITPAYAGKRASTWRGRAGAGDHPRVCGEKDIKQFAYAGIDGITPAYAGKRVRKLSRHQ